MADVTIPEMPVTIQEEPVTIKEEIPIKEETIAEAEVKIPEPEPVVETAEPKRKAGRPVGSKNKEPGKPRKPRAKVVIQEEAVEKIEPEIPRIVEGSMPIPEEAFDLRTAKMLRLLQIQKDHRKEQKRQMYSSWFR